VNLSANTSLWACPQKCQSKFASPNSKNWDKFKPTSQQISDALPDQTLPSRRGFHITITPPPRCMQVECESYEPEVEHAKPSQCLAQVNPVHHDREGLHPSVEDVLFPPDARKVKRIHYCKEALSLPLADDTGHKCKTLVLRPKNWILVTADETYEMFEGGNLVHLMKSRPEVCVGILEESRSEATRMSLE
jgi:hypothetical protein